MSRNRPRPPPTAKTRVLLVDDHDLLRTSVRELLTESGHMVQFAEDGFAALLQIREEVPDIIISDLNTPAMSGVAFLSIVRRRFPHIRVIAMSAAVFRRWCASAGDRCRSFLRERKQSECSMKMVKLMSRPERNCRLRHPFELTPIWIPGMGMILAGKRMS